MRKFLVLVMSTFCSSAFAQDKHCFTTEVYNERMSAHPGLHKIQDDLEIFTRQFESRQGTEGSGGLIVIPIVFHIVHNYGGENISDAQIYDQMRILNEDFRLQNPDTVNIMAPFKPVAADTEIEFRLATIDPNGNCTNGIDRIQSHLTFGADDDSKLNPWPSNQYLNIWVVGSLAYSGAAAYAYYPGTAPPGADGVISIHTYIGSIGTGSPGRSRVLTHEIGHCMNLAHVWGSTNSPGVACGNDGVSDTPLTKGWTTCNLNGSICTPPIIENVQNYMEYSYCCNMFTYGQKARMRAALNSSAGGRNNLWTPANLLATGTDGSPVALCAPISDFSSDQHLLCSGDTIQFTDISWQGQPSSWSWTFPGGTPSTSTDSMPVVFYSLPGIYDVTLAVTNATGSDTHTKTGFITVMNASGANPPYAESFEISFPGADAYVINPDNGNAWQQVTGAAYTGTHSMKLNNFSGNVTGEIDEFITPSFDLSNFVSPTIQFRVAYSQRTDITRKDALKIYYSLNCGKSWTLRYTKNGQTLATVSPHASAWTPSSASDWRLDAVNILATGGKPNVRFKFQAVSARGNNLYIDDINVNAAIAGVEELPSPVSYFEVYPTPSVSVLNIDIELTKSSVVNVDAFDMLGSKVASLPGNLFGAGDHHLRLDHRLANGIYMLQVNCNGNITSKKFVVVN